MSSTEYFSDPDGRFSCCFAKGLLQLDLQGANAFFGLVGEKAEKSICSAQATCNYFILDVYPFLVSGAR